MTHKPSDRFDDWTEPDLEHLEFTEWGWLVSHPDSLTFQGPCDIGAFTYINARRGVFIGTDVQIGSHCALHSSSSIDAKHGSIIINDRVRIGSHTTIMPDVTLGKNVTVAAHSFVTDTVNPGAIVAGIPAEPL